MKGDTMSETKKLLVYGFITVCLMTYAFMIIDHSTHLNPKREDLTYYYGGGHSTSIFLDTSCWYHEVCTPPTQQEIRYRQGWFKGLN